MHRRSSIAGHYVPSQRRPVRGGRSKQSVTSCCRNILNATWAISDYRPGSTCSERHLRPPRRILLNIADDADALPMRRAHRDQLHYRVCQISISGLVAARWQALEFEASAAHGDVILEKG